MNSSDLLKELQKIGIPSRWFNIGDKGNTDNKTVLSLIDNQWAVFYSQRGDKFELKTFDSEDAACKEMLLRMKLKKDRQKQKLVLTIIMSFQNSPGVREKPHRLNQ